MSRRPSALLLSCLLLTGCVGLAAVSDAPTNSAAPEPSQPAPETATAAPTERPSQSIAPSASPTPAPSPTASGGIGHMELEAIGCPGGVVLEWSPATDPRFHHYTALRSPDAEIETPWPPIAPAVDWGDTYATDPFVTSAVDASIIPSETRWNYRVMAYDVENRPLAASPVRQARLAQPEQLGSLDVTASDDGLTRLDWRSFGGQRGCFSSYRVLFAIGSGQPDTVLSVVSDQSGSELETGALHPGATYALRVQAVRTTTLGSFVVGETAITSYVVPGQ